MGRSHCIGEASSYAPQGLPRRESYTLIRAYKVSDAAFDVGKIEPDFDAAEVRAFGANGRGDSCAQMAWRANVPGKLGLYLAELRDFVHRGIVDFLLRIEAGAHSPLVEKVEQRAGFDEADGFRIGKDIQGYFGRHSAVKKLVFCCPGAAHGAFVEFFRARIFSKKHRRDVFGFACVGESEKRA